MVDTRIFLESLRNLLVRPFVLAVPFQVAGIIISKEYPFILPGSVWWAIFGSFLLILFLAARKSHSLATLVFLFGSFLSGVCSQSEHQKPPDAADHVSNLYIGKKVIVTGAVDRAVERGERASQVSISAAICRERNKEAHPCSGRILIYVTDKALPWRAGDEVRAEIKLRSPFKDGNPGSFDYAAYLRNRNYYATAFLRKAGSIEIVHRSDAPPLLTALERKRGDLADWIEKNAGAESAEIVKALVLGMRKAVPREIRETFQAAGTAHLLAISGLHLGIMAVWVFVLVAWVCRRLPGMLRHVSVNQMASAITLPIMWGYAMIAGLHVATLRAAIMISIYLLGRMLWRRADGINSLFVAAFIILIFLPYSMFEVSFQLSFLSVMAIVIGLPRIQAAMPAAIQKTLRRKELRWRIFSNMYFITACSLVCFLATTPVLAAWFNQFSWIGLVMNLFVVPIFSLIIIPVLGLISVLWFIGLPWLEYLLAIPVGVFGFAESLQEKIVEYLGGFVFAPCFPFGTEALYLIGLLISASAFMTPYGRRGRPWSLIWDDRKQKGLRLLIGCTLLLFSFFLALSRWVVVPGQTGGFGAYAPKLSLGTSVLVRFEDGRAELVSPGRIDSGGRDSVRRTLAPMLWSFGLSRIDRLWMASRARKELKAAERLGELVGIDAVVESRAKLSCRLEGSLRRCSLPDGGKDVRIWELPANDDARGRAWVRLLEFLGPDASILVAPSPHRISADAWKGFMASRGGRRFALVYFGPGRLESFRAMIRELAPVSVILAMNRKLRRYLKKNDWLEMQRLFPKVIRTDHAGAVRIFGDGQARALVAHDK